ncbi:sulfate permease-like protein [Byssothecium circinans]|uniref:Sulfate permease-like protein n=1 Tax=Byssothecium circinans TaxID=147558 RepID=A0A6A5TCT7_9PLEO|nr:sulfate permease-like protein [Byssothecium circinans]
MGIFSKAGEAFKTDYSLRRVRNDSARAARALPGATLNYLIEKVPVIQWLPKYNPRWVMYDTLAGITVGVLLIPQALAYAKIATIPVSFGLMSSWLPNFLYFFMGTSKDMSTGPTSLMGLLTAEIVHEVSKEGEHSPQAIASAVAMSVGIYCLAVGLLKIGFLLEFISIPTLHGFISGVGIVIMLGQIPSLFGVKVGTGTANIIKDLFTQIPKFDGPTIGVGFGGIALLIILEKIGSKWGKKNKIIWAIGLARSAIVLVLFTGLSYGLNKNRVKDPIFELSKVQSNGIATPVMPSASLITIVFPRAIAPFLAATIEHLAIAKAFGRKNDYVIDPAQELVYLGTTNFFNAFFSAMPVGGAMSRTAVNSATGVKSPAYGIVTGGFVLLAIFKLSPALFWIPKATLAAIIVLAVWGILSSPKVFYHYWRTSFVDFTGAMLAFWITLFINTETAIAAAVGWQVACFILTNCFSRVRRTNQLASKRGGRFAFDFTSVPADTQVFKPHVSLIFFNAFSIKEQCFDAIQTYNSGSTLSVEAQVKNRNWSTAGARKARQLRARANIVDEPEQIRVVVVDLGMVSTIDTTGIIALQDLKADLEKYGGETAEIRFANVHEAVRERFVRFGWDIFAAENCDLGERAMVKGMPVYESVDSAVGDRFRKGTDQDSAEFYVGGVEKV